MTRSCARPGCGDPATATFGYDYAERTVFLDPLADEAHPASYDVCRRHADNLSVPRGWQLVRSGSGAQFGGRFSLRSLMGIFASGE